MKAAIEEALAGVEAAHGGPFGAVVVQAGRVIATGHNNVVATDDPTAHAEILAIRSACRALGRFELSDCELYTTCEPCPMCYAAAWWARIPTIYYGCSRDDAAGIGFDDAAIYDDLAGKSASQVQMRQIERNSCLVPMRRWAESPNRVPY
jgi:guanine deaminase